MSRTSLLRTAAAVSVVAALLLAGQASFGQATSRQAIKVKWGDSLWSLSQRYGVNMGQLASDNHMKFSDVLYAGRTLYLPAGAKGTSTGSAGTKPSGGSSSEGGVPADPRLAQRRFCTSYKPPTGPKGQLPPELTRDPSRLVLRPLFAKWARVYGVPVDLIEGEAWQESGWSNTAVSPDGARGIGQLLPATALWVNQSLGTNLKLNVASDNIRLMAAFLGYLLRMAGGQVCGAVASYYQGFPTLQRYGVLPVSQVYVRSVLSLRPRFG
jgi:LysM repeat protein